MDVNARREAAEALRAIKRGGEGWYSLSEAVMGRPAPRDEVVSRLADLIDPGEDTTVSAYDLLYTIDGGEHTSKEIFAEMMKRLMPEGMGWPRFEDGEPVRIGDDFEDLGQVAGIKFGAGGVTIEGTAGNSDLFITSDERVKRPAVLAADGEPLEAGQTVWHEDGTELRVLGFKHEEDGERIVSVEYMDGPTNWSEVRSLSLTHQRPVLDVDGVPIDEGDTVWNATTSAGPFTVREIERSDDPDEPEDIVWCGERAANGFKVWRIAGQLTHTKPEIDTWERIEEDAGCTATKYNERRGTIFTTKQQVARDLVRRCRALSERERGE